MKKIPLKVVKQCVATDGVEPEYIRAEVMPEFFKNFWVRRMALDRRNYNQLVETTLEIAMKVGASDVIGRVVEDLKDESEPYRRMVMETITKVIEKLGTADVDARLEELLVDGILYAFQEQTADDNDVMLRGFGTVVVALGKRSKPYLPQICGTIKWRLNNKNAEVRQQAADLVARDRQGYEDLRRRAAHGPPGGGTLRVLGRGVPRGAGFDPRRVEGDRERHGMSG